MSKRRSTRASNVPVATRTPLEGLAFMKVVCLPVGLVDPDPDQPRSEFDDKAIDLLAGSLASLGQLQPITVRPVEKTGRYQVVFGERRWRAARRAGIETVDAVVLPAPLPRATAWEIQIAENALRVGLKPLEQARAFRSLMDARGWSRRQLAERLNIHHGTVARSLKLLDLPEALKKGVEAGAVAPSTAQAVARVKGLERRADLADRAAAGRLSRDQAESEAAGTTRSVVKVTNGRVVIELNHPADLEALVNAALEAAAAIEVEGRDAEPGRSPRKIDANRPSPKVREPRP